MEMYLYEEEVKKLKLKHGALLSDINNMGIVLTLVTVSLIVSYIVFSFRHFEGDILLLFFFGLFVIICTDVIIMTLYCESKKRKFFYDEVNKVIINILRSELNLDLTNTKDMKEYKKELRQTRVQDGDFINLYGAFDYQNEDIKGTVYNVIFSRSNGKTSYETLRGLVLRFRVDSSLNSQIRDDMFAPFKMHKVRDDSTKAMRLYVPKREEGKYDDTLVGSFNYLKENFNAKSVGIDVSNKEAVIYINYMKYIPRIKKYDSEDIENYCKMFVNGIEASLKIKEILERNY